MTDGEKRSQRLVEIKARLAAATPGEWTANLCEWVCINSLEHSNQCKEDCSTCDDACIIQAAIVPQIKTVEYDEHVDMNDADAEFCANAKQDIPWLLEKIEELEAACVKNWGCFLVESLHTDISRKWAQRWKRIAKHVGGRSTLHAIRYSQECLEHKTEVCEEQAQRIKELEAENASLYKLYSETAEKRWGQDERIKELERENQNLEWSRDNAIKCEDKAIAREAIFKKNSEDKDEYIAALENACMGCATCVFHDRKMEHDTCLAQPGYGSGVMFACWEFDQDRYAMKGDDE